MKLYKIPLLLQIKSQASALREFFRPFLKVWLLGFGLLMVNRFAGLVLPLSMKYLIDDVIGANNRRMLFPLLLIIGAATIVQALSSFAVIQLLSKTALQLIADLRAKLQAHIARLPVSYYDATTTGAIVSRVMNDTESIRNLAGSGFIDFIGSVVTAALALCAMLILNPVLTTLMLLLILCFSIVMLAMLSKLTTIYSSRYKITADVTGRLTEFAMGIRVIKGYCAEEKEADVFSKGTQELLRNCLQSHRWSSMLTLSYSLVAGVIGILVAYVGAEQIFSGRLSLGGLVTFLTFLAFLVIPVFQIVVLSSQLSESLAGFGRVQEILALPTEDQNPRRTQIMGLIEGRVLFENVTFTYDGKTNVLHDLSFEALPGSVTALVGPSGSGKSTITNLIASFYTPQSGMIRVDGVDLSTACLKSYRSQVGIVLQDTFLFDGSIRDNVAYARPGACGKDILEACRIARVDEFAERSECEYDRVTGERGNKLSGGQQQRVSIARAILASPRILILDEATSSLDSESEALIQQGLSFLMQGRTTFVIAHRLSTIRQADQVLVIEEGRITERGTHDSLLARGGRYYEFYNRQHNLESDQLVCFNASR